MFSKRIVISIIVIVIGCLVQLITCPDGNTGRGMQPRRRPPARGAPITARDLGGKPNSKVQNQQPATESQKTKGNQDKEPEKEKSNVGYVGKAFKLFGRFKDFSKKMCPFRFAHRVIKKTMGLNEKNPNLTVEIGSSVPGANTKK